MYQRFIDNKLIEYEKTQLERKHPDFKALMKEYRDGILLFEISDQNIWTKAIKDTSGLKEFFNANRNKWEYPNRVNATVFSSSSKKIIKKAYSLKKKDNISNDSIITILNKENPLNISFENKLIEDFKVYNSSYEDLEKGINNPTLINNKWFFVYAKEKLDQRQKELKEAEGIIVSAYQNYLEESWIKSLKKKYAIKIDYNTLYSIKEKP
jgi:peptidyl-prolyl cis-trans isomerase SurA